MIDTHCHLYDTKLLSNLDELLLMQKSKVDKLYVLVII